jgi:hypothetical protein
MNYTNRYQCQRTTIVKEGENIAKNLKRESMPQGKPLASPLRIQSSWSLTRQHARGYTNQIKRKDQAQAQQD